MTKKMFLLFGLLGALSIQPFQSRAADGSAAVTELIERLAPGHSRDFVIETISSSAGEDVFEVAGRKGKIVLRGNSPLSQAVALNWYLKHDALVDVSWYADDPINIPATLPVPSESVRKTTRLQNRFFLNYCTFGYTMPFWQWRDWERCIDWMALNGINLPLAQTGNEYIWQKVWRQYGLSDNEIRAFFTGPAYLPWHRMVNIDHWDGPLPQSYIEGQFKLQKKILERERALGMDPILCAFSGHVPEVLKAHQPAMRIQDIPPGWGKFSSDYACHFLDPLDPAFKEVQVKFLNEQKKEYGESRHYGVDPFNEIAPPNWEPDYLASVSRAIYSGMAEVRPDAIWMQMAWTFSLDRKRWTDERLSAMINAVPRGRMVLLDYVCENRELFRETQSFYGAPFIWDYLGNFGGNTYLVGPANKINNRLTAAMNDSALTNLVGVGATLEGLNNPAIYELLFDRVWAGPNLDLTGWLREEARARAGCSDTNVEQAWNILGTRVLVDDVNPIGGHGTIFQMRTPALRGNAGNMLSFAIPYDNADLMRAWASLLQASAAAKRSSAYQRDLCETTRQALGNLGLGLRDEMAGAYEKKDVAAFKKAANRFMELGRDLDAFLGTRSEFMIGKWINDAKSWAANGPERVYYERDARSIITVWGGPRLTDYAGRSWNGLLRDYYLPRWQVLIDHALVSLKTGKPIDTKAVSEQCRDCELKFIASTGNRYAAKAKGDLVARSQALFDKYESVPPMPANR